MCTACSSNIITSYKREGHVMIMKACNNPYYLEHTTRLDELKRHTDALQLDIDWSSDE